MLEKKVQSLSSWADTAAEKLRKDQQLRQEVEAENESLRSRVMVLTEATERLRTRIAMLTENETKSSAATGADSNKSNSNANLNNVSKIRSGSTDGGATQKRLLQLEDTLSSARDSLKRKRDRERKLIQEKNALEASVSSLSEELRSLTFVSLV
jgi:chromosome segregation ATPase